MGRVCLILPLSSVHTISDDYITVARTAFESTGADVEVVVAASDAAAHPSTANPIKWVIPSGPGLVSAAISGLLASEGRSADFFVILDPGCGFRSSELDRILEPLRSGRSDVAVARVEKAGSSVTLSTPLVERCLSWLTGPFLGVSNPATGLVALSPRAAFAVRQSSTPVGSRFALDLVLRSKGRRAEVAIPVDDEPPAPRLEIDDLRHLKRLADDRFGNASRLIQFCAVGASGMMVDLTFYALFQILFSRTGLSVLRAPVVGGTLDLAFAGALAILIALTWNFSLNRRLTFSYARHGSIIRQYVTYALSNALGIALSFSLRLYLPAHFSFFENHRLAAAVVGIVTATGISFSMSRWLVFSRRSVDRDASLSEAHSATTQAVASSHAP